MTVDRTAIVGVGYTPLTARSGVSVHQLAVDAVRAALDDAGIAPHEVDGMASYQLSDSVRTQAVATALAMPHVEYLLDVSLGGQAPSFLLLQADAAIRAGLAQTVVIYRAMNGRSGVRVGSDAHATGITPAASYRHAVGFDAYPQVIAMWARRYMIETGATEHDLAAVVMAQRTYAAANPRAVVRAPLSLDDYFASPMVASPFRVADCTREVDGAVAVVMTSVERARDLQQPVVVLHGGAYASAPRPGLDYGDILLTDDYSRNGMHALRDKLWRNSGLGPSEVDVAEIYDCFSSAVLFGLEGLGLADRGEAGELVRSGETALGGRLPTNTNGGLLCEGYVHGMNTVAEAVMQLRGQAGERTVTGAEVAVATSGTLMDGSAVVLTTDV